MHWWQWLLDGAGVAVLLLVAYGVALMARRRWLARNGGTFELSVRLRTDVPERGWALGIGRYSGSTLEWFRVFSLFPTPRRRWERHSLAYVSSRQPEGKESWELYPEHVVVLCDSAFGDVELAMSPRSLIGFQAWLESRNPGADWGSAR